MLFQLCITVVVGRYWVKAVDPLCTEELKALGSHTLCLTDNTNVISSGLKEGDKQTILDIHNKFRGEVEPPATDLTKLQWDERLAVVAQKWAKQCNANHDTDRSVPEIGMIVGQNLAAGHRSWKSAITRWYNEKNNLLYGVGKINPRKPVGHYTQMVQKDTFLIGCGYAECSTGFKRYYICNYAEVMWAWNLKTPYTNGTRCGSCPKSCEAGLCDCGRLVCYNGGKMDKNECKCSCSFYWEGEKCDQKVCGGLRCKNRGTLDKSTCTCKCTKIYTGKTCEALNCPAKDRLICGQGKDWPPSYCIYSNVKDDCPYMCKKCQNKCGFVCENSGTMDYKACTCSCPEGFVGHRCEKKVCGGLKCQNGGSLDKRSCKCKCEKLYTGKSCETLNCPAKDLWICGDYWPPWHCLRYHKARMECPYMCKICQSKCGFVCENGGTLDYKACTCSCPEGLEGNRCERKVCDGLKCQNGGDLDKQSCKCKCRSLYTGKSCETLAQCPKNDPRYCGGHWPPSYCKYGSVRTKCPWMCGICKKT